MAIFFSISSGASYMYFKPLLSSKSSVETYTSGAQPDVMHEDETDVPQSLYTSEGGNGSTLNYSGLNSDSDLAIAEHSIKKYLERFNAALIDLYMDGSGIIYVDIGDELQKNFMGDALEEFNIIAGLYTTIERAVPGFRAMKILINGKETETLGGHIDISFPIGGEIAGGADNI